MLQVSVLGPIEVRHDDVAIRVPAGKAAELLVRLALDVATVVRTDQLLDDLWADEAVTTRRNTLQSKIARLRRALGDASPVDSRDGGYVLALERTVVDAYIVGREAAEAASRLDAGDASGAARLATTALTRFRGPVLPSVNGSWVEPHRTRLEATRTDLLETAFAARLQLGEASGLIGDLEVAVADQPFVERLWGLLITALYRAGRQADVLAAYQRVRSLLAKELGLDPGEPLRHLEGRILDHDPELGGPVQASSPPRVASNLPSIVVELVGRDADLRRTLDAVAGHRLVQIVGSGGVGKTALAIEVGRRLADPRALEPTSVWLVRLDGTTSASEVTDAVIATLGVTGGEAALVERLRLGDGCLLLDNCEHVVDHVAALAIRLLDATPSLRILATSQAPLGTDGDVVVELAPLPLAAAVELFARRATAHGRPSGSHHDVEELCRSLDGLPLAIELAAARTKTLSVADITRRLDDRFAILSDPTNRRSNRQRALRSTIVWSYGLLFPDDQRGLWALAAFTGGAALEAVEHVLDALDVPAAAAIDVVGRLANRSLLIVDETEDGGVRYRLLDSIRAYVREAMAEAGETDRARRAHAEWFAAAAADATAGTRGPEQAVHLAFVRTERANIDAALWAATADPAMALRTAVGFGWSWIVLGDSRGAERLLAALAAASETVPAVDRAAALLLAGWIEASLGDLEHAHAHVGEAAGIATAAGDDDLLARCSYHLAYVVSHQGRWQDAYDLTEQCARLYDRLDRPWDQAANALFAARAAISEGDANRGDEACQRAEHWLEHVDDPWLHVRFAAMLGELARVQRRFVDAVDHLTRAAATSSRLGFRQTEAYQLSALGRAQCQNGDYAGGTRTLVSSVGKAEAIGDSRLAALVRVHLGRVRRAQGDAAGARVELEAAARWHRRVGGGEQAALGECLLAALDGGADVGGEVGSGDAHLEAILAEARQRDDAPVEVFATDALALRAARRGDLRRARQLCRDSDRRMAAASHFITELDRVDARTVRAIA